MDDLLALMEAPGEIGPTSQLRNSPGRGNPDRKKINERHDEKSKRPVPSLSANNNITVDPLTKIRIKSRAISSIELVDILSPFQFHSTCALTSIRKHDISKLIRNPSSSKGDPCSRVSGKTNMATIGIVFTNSGTHISSSGSAFTVITIGDLHTGPTVTVMLFEHAYSKFMTMIKPGAVLAVLGPSILPPKCKDSKKRDVTSTKISLSVRGINQIVVVGKASDYGICAGNIIKKVGKRAGSYDDMCRCKNYVDTRIGRYCKSHSEQKQENNCRSGNTNTILSLGSKHQLPINRSNFESAKLNVRPTILNPIGKSNCLSRNVNDQNSSNSVSLKSSLSTTDIIFNNGDEITTTGFVSNRSFQNSTLQRPPLHMKNMSFNYETRKKITTVVQHPFSKNNAIPNKPKLSISNETSGRLFQSSKVNELLVDKKIPKINSKKRLNIVHIENSDNCPRIPKLRRVVCQSNKERSTSNKDYVIHNKKSVLIPRSRQFRKGMPITYSPSSKLITKCLSTKLNSSKNIDVDKLLRVRTKQR